MRKRPPETPAPCLRVHGWASSSASLRADDDVIDRIGSGLRTPRKYEEDASRGQEGRGPTRSQNM